MDGQFSDPPESYLKVINPMIEAARGFLEKGEKIVPIAFVGNFSSGKTMQIQLQSGSREEKNQSATAIHFAAEMLEADFVFIIMEAWSLLEDKVAQTDAIVDKYGSIANSPYRVDIVQFSLETRDGFWMAACKIKPKGISKKKRTIGKADFRFFTEIQGRFSNFLKAAPEDEAKPPLH